MIKVILTGHSRGLGRALAGEFIDRGVKVLGVSREPAAWVHTASGLSECQLDLADIDALGRWLDTGVLADFFADANQALLINNAACLQPIGLNGTLGRVPVAAAVAVNVAAPMMLCDAFLRDVKTVDRRILHVSSGAARTAYAGWSVYCASKAALDRHAEALALEGHAGLRVASVAPGVIDTDMQGEIRATDPAGFPAQQRFLELKKNGQLAVPEDVARRLADFLLSPHYGQTVLADLRDA